MALIPVRDAFLTVAIMSVTFLVEIGFFALYGAFLVKGKLPHTLLSIHLSSPTIGSVSARRFLPFSA
ncbi:hypothetical protein [Bradyrhizobium sp. CCGUVB23]|uniref:hypothetical protein n=1 Tax=Bradyrhizobium sp. CCGUVB23 TaxID=2949630 RepID=UPI0020B1AB05|nr:hypothetical protein [Bradyrhizobium sp. CCGUVB23]MCP3464449.1 hypothetical protein [Bradyrhizobium sp. CCGUVB23]